MGLRLGAPLCKPHTCQHCGAQFDQQATHGLSCHHSEGRHHQNSAINDILHRALTLALVPSRLEPSSLSRTDGKCPDGLTVVPWSKGKLLVWDATCPDTYAPSYTAIASKQAGAVAATAEERKKAMYTCLFSCRIFTPVAVETAGVFGPETSVFLRELSGRLRLSSGEEKSHAYLLQ